MISKPVLRDLINQRVKDAKALFSGKRYYSSFYMAGYAIELALKYKICKMFYFSKGFPETKIEFQQYYKRRESKYKKIRTIISKIHEIKHHDLARLLVYSGEEYNIIDNHYTEWMIVLQWNPEMRYRNTTIKKAIARNNLNAITILLKSIL